MAAEYVRRDVEIRLAHGVDLADARRVDWLYTVDRTRNVLRVIEDVIEIRAQLDLLATFTDGEVLEDREIHVLNRRQLERIATSV